MIRNANKKLILFNVQKNLKGVTPLDIQFLSTPISLSVNSLSANIYFFKNSM